jgi:hypothetical protein
MRERMMARPLLSVLVLELFFSALVIVGAATLTALFPRLPGYSVRGLSQSLILVLVMMAVLLAMIAAFRWWSLAGFNPASRWRELRLYWLPVLLLVVPFVGGVRMPPGSAIALLAVA